MAVVSRLQLDHPALGTTGGAGLHASVEALFLKMGDAVNARWFSLADFDQTEVVDLLHNFSTDIGNLRIDLWNFSGGEWVNLTSTTTPLRSAFTIIEKVSFEGSTLQITNNTGGNDLTFAVSLVFDPLYLSQGDIKDVDITTVLPEDGQALVFQSSTSKFKPGASGDSSFKLNSIATPSLSLKGGYIELTDGRELATYSGSGTVLASYGTDLTLNLTTILGSAPANATNYYLYLDLSTLGAVQTISDTGRAVYRVVEANFSLSVITPETTLTRHPNRYLPVGNILSATSGTAWSGAGSAFTTFSTKKHDNGPAWDQSVAAVIGQGLAFDSATGKYKPAIPTPAFVAVAGNVTLTDQKIHLVDTAASRTLTLPSPAVTSLITIKDATGTCNAFPITIVRAASEKIDNVAASYLLDTDFGAWTLVSNGTDWFII